MAMGHTPVPPVNIPIPTKILTKMGGAPTPKWHPLVLTTTAISVCPAKHDIPVISRNTGSSPGPKWPTLHAIHCQVLEHKEYQHAHDLLLYRLRPWFLCRKMFKPCGKNHCLSKTPVGSEDWVLVVYTVDPFGFP